jgi:hypothetical protein
MRSTKAGTFPLRCPSLEPSTGSAAIEAAPPCQPPTFESRKPSNAGPTLALSVEQACAALGVSWDTWHTTIEPDVRIVRLGRRKLIPVASIERWLDEHAETTLERR